MKPRRIYYRRKKDRMIIEERVNGKHIYKKLLPHPEVMLDILKNLPKKPRPIKPMRIICGAEGCNRWITSERLDKGHSSCWKHTEYEALRRDKEYGINMNFHDKVVRPVLLRLRGSKCEDCKKDFPHRSLHVHHEDYNDQVIDKLRLLCSSCHRLRHSKGIDESCNIS